MLYPNKVMVTRAPLGIGYIASHLKRAGHKFRLFDTTFIRCGDCPGDDALREKNLQVVNPDFDELGLVEKEVDVFAEFLKEIADFKPDIIGMSTVDPNHNFGMEMLNYCKKHYPDIPVIVGGPVTTLVPEEVYPEESIDIIGRGECEEAIVELCNRLDNGSWEDIYDIPNLDVKDKDYKTNGIIHKNPCTLPNVEFGLAPDLEIYDPRHFLRPLGGKMYSMATVIWTRGCIFRCSYCANETFYKAANATPKEYYRMKNPKMLVEELAAFKEKFNLNFFMFVDDIWPLHRPDITSEFCELYKKLVNVPFSINLQCQLVKEECFAMAVDAGLRNICLGVESGSYRVRKEVLKRIYKDEDVLRVLRFAKKYKIRHSTFNIIGLPFENREDIMQTISLNRRANPSSATVTFFHPYRGAPMRKQCIELGYIDENEQKHEDVYRSESQIRLPQITQKELSGLMASFQLYMKLPEKYFKLIEMQEDQSTFEAQLIREKILVPEFKKIMADDPQWDFTHPTKWWSVTREGDVSVSQELYPGYNADDITTETGRLLPGTQPGDAGFFPMTKDKKLAKQQGEAMIEDVLIELYKDKSGSEVGGCGSACNSTPPEEDAERSDGVGLKVLR